MFEVVLRALELAGVDTPAFQELFNEVLTTLGESDAAVLQQKYEASYARAKAQHDAAQNG